MQSFSSVCGPPLCTPGNVLSCISFCTGGSIAKLAYRSNRDFKNGEPVTKHPKEGHGYIRLKGFTQFNVEDLLDFIVKNCDMTKGEDGFLQAHTTGILINQYKEKIEERLHAK